MFCDSVGLLGKARNQQPRSWKVDSGCPGPRGEAGGATANGCRVPLKG